MIIRRTYLDRLIAFQDKDLIKVVTGIRRCGKSTLLEMMAQYLIDSGVSQERVFMFKMESMELAGLQDYRALYDLVRQKTQGIEKPYLFFDELQEVEDWERAINALRVDIECDIYITGSNAFLLSSELATMLSGRYVEVKMLPLTFAEYLDFRKAKWFPRESPQSDIALFEDGSFATLASLLDDFRRYGGLPFLALQSPDRQMHEAYIESLYNTVVVRDVLERDRRRGRRVLTSPDLLERLVRFLADNVGNENSVNSIAGVLRSDGAKASNDTVDAYLGALSEGYLFMPCKRYDIKGKALLKTGGKNYIADVGIRSWLDGYRDTDSGRVFENLVFLQLLFDGYHVNVGHLRSGEVDFVASRADERIYIQVAEDMTDSATMERELRPLRMIRDAYPKRIVVLKGDYPSEIEGIRIIKAEDFMLHR